MRFLRNRSLKLLDPFGFDDIDGPVLNIPPLKDCFKADDKTLIDILGQSATKEQLEEKVIFGCRKGGRTPLGPGLRCGAAFATKPTCKGCNEEIIQHVVIDKQCFDKKGGKVDCGPKGNQPTDFDENLPLNSCDQHFHVTTLLPTVFKSCQTTTIEACCGKLTLPPTQPNGKPWPPKIKFPHNPNAYKCSGPITKYTIEYCFDQDGNGTVKSTGTEPEINAQF